MSYITLKCKNCGSGMSINPDSKTITCIHCGSTFMMVDLLDEKDMAFASKLSQEDLQKKMEFAEALKHGDTYLFQAEYKLAEESFKRAIELDDKNHRGYLGVVKAKTSNLNKIPNSKDYKEYAKLAIDYAPKEEAMFIRSELAKLTFLEREKEIQKRELEEKQVKLLNSEKNRKENQKFFSRLAGVIFVSLTIVILSCIYFIDLNKEKPRNSANAATYEITTAESFVQASQKDNFLSSTIIIKNDINFHNQFWKPIGTQNRPFTGTIYGNGYTISNLKIKPSTAEGKSYTGFFGYTKDANILSLNFDNVSITETKSVTYQTQKYIGFVCGYGENTIIRKCQIKNTCSLDLDYQNKCVVAVGGIIGEANNCMISYSYSNSDISCDVKNIQHTSWSNSPLNYYVGGICGNFSNSSLSNCYSSGNIQNYFETTISNEITAYVGGLVGCSYQKSNSEDKITTCYFAGAINSFLKAPAKKQYMAGIVGYGANFDQMTNNFSIFDETTFVKDNVYMSTSNFYDYSSNANSVKYISSDKIIEKIEQFYLSDYWSNSNTLTPALKTN